METFRYLPNVTTLRLNEKDCVGCGMCEIVCPHGVFSLHNKKARIHDIDGCLCEKLSFRSNRCVTRGGLCGVYHSDLDQRQERRRLQQCGMLLIPTFLIIDPRKPYLPPVGDPLRISQPCPSGRDTRAGAQCVLPRADGSKTNSLNSCPTADLQ